MLWPNLNWPSVVWKKLDRVKDLCNCVNSLIFGGLPTGKGRMEREVCRFFFINLNRI